MRRWEVITVLAGALLVGAVGQATARGVPQGPEGWFCVLDLGTWHCSPQGVDKNLGGPSAPSVNFECDQPGDSLCVNDPTDPDDEFSIGPPAGTHFVGTENLIRIDLYAGQPCPRGTSGVVELPFGTYRYCHHYAP
ncbi:MAG TPA: hypothetical protein VE962_07815 [Actinomycetota bacterium]|jgi:hypothetical protein|nr:hypothetical protein [Actinomycetota bacterium]